MNAKDAQKILEALAADTVLAEERLRVCRLKTLFFSAGLSTGKMVACAPGGQSRVREGWQHAREIETDAIVLARWVVDSEKAYRPEVSHG